MSLKRKNEIDMDIDIMRSKRMKEEEEEEWCEYIMRMGMNVEEHKKDELYYTYCLHMYGIYLRDNDKNENHERLLKYLKSKNANMYYCIKPCGDNYLYECVDDIDELKRMIELFPAPKEFDEDFEETFYNRRYSNITDILWNNISERIQTRIMMIMMNVMNDMIEVSRNRIVKMLNEFY